MKPRTLALTVLAANVLAAPAAFGAVEFSNPSAAGGLPSQAVVSATVQGSGDVYVEYAHAQTTYPSVKGRYVSDGLIAMWDGDDNQGTGAHDPSATTWVDLTGRHSPMTFTAAPTVGATYYDLSAGGGGTPAKDIAEALNDGKTTIEVVCNVRSLVNDSTLFACVDGTDTSTHAAGNRIVWVRHTSGYVVACCEYKETQYHSLCNVDSQFGTVRSYVFEFNADDAPNASKIFVDGVYNQTVSSRENKKGNAANAWFSLAQRVCAAGASAAISDLRIHCVRVYNRILTADEIAANHAQDVARFFGATHAVDLDYPARRTMVATNFLGTVGAPVANAKYFYATNGLVAMWDGEDNQGTGAHVAGATTWVDLTGRHSAMTFTNALPTIGANYYDVSAGGGFITDASDIAAALNAEACTVEIVCDPKSLCDSGTLFACTDKNVKRIAWARMGNSASATGVVGSMEYKASSYYTPFSKFDTVLNQVRSYTFTYSSDSCRLYKDGSSEVATSVVNKGISGDTASAYFSLGQRISQSSQSDSVADLNIYCLRVYDRVLTPEEIAVNHARDVERFFGASSALPLGSRQVTRADGTKTFVQNGAAVFPLSGLRPDVANYTARLLSPGGTPSAAFDFSTGSEFEDSAWFDHLDSNVSDADTKKNGPAIDIGFAMNGKVPVVKTKYQLLANENDRFPFGVSSTSPSTSTTAGIFNGTADHNQYRYRVGTSAYYADTNVVDLLAVHELVLNGPDGTFLNGALLNADLKGVAETSPISWGVFARHAKDGSYETYQCAKVRMWYFKLWADGTLVRDLVPARKRGVGVGLFDRENGVFYPNIGNRGFILGPERPAPQLSDEFAAGSRFTATLTREGTASSDVSVAYGADFGGGDPTVWDHFEPLDVGFAEGATSLSVQVSGIDEEVRYVRFYSREDGWSETAYIPEVHKLNPFVLIVR